MKKYYTSKRLEYSQKIFENQTYGSGWSTSIL